MSELAKGGTGQTRPSEPTGSNTPQFRKTGQWQIVDVPLGHYKALYEQSDAKEIEARTGLRFDREAGRFELVLVGKQYYVNHPVFETGVEAETYEGILLLRYLLEGKFAPASGRMLAFDEMPWGHVYATQFQGRVIGRFARAFGRDPMLLSAAVEGIPGLRFERIGGADSAYRFEFLNGLYLDVLVWMADDEFPASAQMLFSDNFKYAFTAEDMAVVGDVAVSRLKRALVENK